MLREEVRVACKQMMIEFEMDDYELYDNVESQVRPDFYLLFSNFG
jgi:hypothetical protein